jgi:hypothetical protein
MATSSRSTPVLIALLAALAVYAAYTGAGIEMLGMSGLQARGQRVAAIKDTIALY